MTMVMTEHARLSQYPFATISDEGNRDSCLMNIKSRVEDLSKKGKNFLYFLGFAEPTHSQIIPELSIQLQFNSGRLSPGEALAIQALGQEVHYFANRVGASVPLDKHIQTRIIAELKLDPNDKLGLIDFAEGMSMFGAELLNVVSLREILIKGKNFDKIPPVLLERYKVALDLNTNIIKGQVISSIEDVTRERVETDIEGRYHLSKLGEGPERDELITKIKSRQRGIEFAALIYGQGINISFQEGLSFNVRKDSLVRSLVKKFSQ